MLHPSVFVVLLGVEVGRDQLLIDTVEICMLGRLVFWLAGQLAIDVRVGDYAIHIIVHLSILAL